MPKKLFVFPKKKKLFLISVFIGSFVALLIFNQFALKPTYNIFHLISAPLQKICWRAGDSTANFFKMFFEAHSLREKNQELTKENLFLKEQLLDLKDIKKENALLREMLALQQTVELDLVLVEVLSKQLNSDLILINQGKNQGLKPGMPLITEEKVLVGIIDDVFADFAQVKLISANQTSFSIEIESVSATSADAVKSLGVAKGRGDERMFFDMVPEDALVEKGDLVLTSSLDDKFLPGLLVGEVKAVAESASQPFLQGEIEAYFKKTNWQKLFVVLNYARP